GALSPDAEEVLGQAAPSAIGGRAPRPARPVPEVLQRGETPPCSRAQDSGGGLCGPDQGRSLDAQTHSPSALSGPTRQDRQPRQSDAALPQPALSRGPRARAQRHPGPHLGGRPRRPGDDPRRGAPAPPDPRSREGLPAHGPVRWCMMSRDICPRCPATSQWWAADKTIPNREEAALYSAVSHAIRRDFPHYCDYNNVEDAQIWSEP